MLLSRAGDYRPRRNHSDANRNLISNIHVRGVSPEDAAARILHFAEWMMKLGASGYHIREELPPAGLPNIAR
ncbi:MAG: ethanolamine ammonia-lyase light chain EutC [Terriglobales bacterium]